MFEVLIIFRDLSPGPATSKNKWVSAFKSVRGKPENQRFYKCHDLLIIHPLHHNIVFFQNQTSHQSSFAATQEPNENAELDQLGERAGRGAPGPDIEGLSLNLRLPGQIVPNSGEFDTCQLLRLVNKRCKKLRCYGGHTDVVVVFQKLH